MKQRMFVPPMAGGCATAAFVLACVLVWAPTARALDATELEPAEAMEGKTFELEQEVVYQDLDESETDSETSLEYEFNERTSLKLTVPVEWEQDEDTEVGAGLRLKYVFNPYAERAPIVAASIEGIAPLDGDGGVDGEAMLYLTKGIGGNDGKHKLHLSISGYYDGDADSDDRDFRYAAIAGYSFQATPKTSLVVDFEREQLEESGENANILEAGVKHEFNDTVAVSMGLGAGLGEESPDFVARAGISFRFGPKRH